MAPRPATRVRRGAARLDKLIPDWFKKVRITELDMADCSVCVIGQLDRAGYSPILEKKGLDAMPDALGFSASTFDWSAEDDEYELLDQLWKGEIRERRAAA